MEEYSYTSTHPLGHTGPVTRSLYFYHLSHKVWENALNLKHVFRIVSEIFLILRRIRGDFFFLINLRYNSCKGSLIIVAFQSNLNFLDRLSKNAQMSNFMQIRPVGAEFFHAEKRTNKQTEKQTDMQTEIHDETSSHFTQFSTSPITYTTFVYRRQQYFRNSSQSLNVMKSSMTVTILNL